MDIRRKVTDPLGNEIFLTEETSSMHVNLDERIKHAVEHPRFIVKAKNSSGKIYLDLVDIFNENSIMIRALEVVVDENNKIVTWFARRTINDTLREGDVIYDARNHDLQI